MTRRSSGVCPRSTRAAATCASSGPVPSTTQRGPRRVTPRAPGTRLSQSSVVEVAAEHHLLERVVADDQAARRVRGDDPALVDDGDAVAEALGLVHEVRDQDDRGAAVADLLDEVPGDPPRGGVEPRGHLVEEDDLGRADERQSDEQPLALPAGEAREGSVPLLREPPLLDAASASPRRRARATRRGRAPPTPSCGRGGAIPAVGSPCARAGRRRDGPGPCRARAPCRPSACAAPARTRRWSSCRRRWTRAGRRSRPARPRTTRRRPPRRDGRRPCAGVPR